jgi:hypothetical protein
MLLWVICETCLLKCKFQVYEKMYLNILLFIVHEWFVLASQPASGWNHLGKAN